jgi:hypothetical protein
MSPGPWLTPHIFEIYYLSAVNSDPAITNMIFIRVNIYPEPGEGGLQLISKAMYFIRDAFYLAALAYNIKI